MLHKELPQAWWFDSHNRAKPSRWLSNTLSELDDKTKQMLDLIEQDADSFAQRAEMYYKKRPLLVDMLGDLYRAHRSLAEQCELRLKHGSTGTRRHTVFGLSSSCTQQSRSQSQVPMTMSSGKTTPGSSSCCSGSSTYDSESEVDDPEPTEEHELEEEEVPETEAAGSSSQEEEEQRQQQERVEQMRAEIERLKAQNAALQKVAEENAALKAELAAKDEEKREAIRQLASSFVMVREENRTLRDRIRESKSSSFSRAFDLKKVAKGLFSARLFTAHCRPTGPIVAL